MKILTLLLLPSILVLSQVETKEDFLNCEDIHNIYNTYIKPYETDEFKYRYVPLPIEKNVGPWKWEGRDLARVIPLLEFERYVKENNISSSKALSLNSSNDPEWNFIDSNIIHTINYTEDTINNDLHNLNLEDHDYDFVMVNQTLEHVYDPIRCLKNIYKHMRPNSILYFNVPINNIPHSTPFHFYTGFTPTGIAAMLITSGFRILEMGAWGNLQYTLWLYRKYDWADYTKFSNPGINDFRYPVSGWAFAIKD